MKYLLIAVLLMISLSLSAQQDAKKSFAAIGGTFLNKDNSQTFGGMVNIGYGVNDYASLGLGVEYFRFKGDTHAYWPVYGHIKVYFGNKAACPYITIAPGYGIYNQNVPNFSSTPGHIRGGIFFAGSIGVHLRDMKKNERLGPFLQLGIKHLSFSSTGVPGAPEGSENFLSLDLGFRF